jgi:DNA-binding LacI/PurR family transcriptional regulator
LRFHIAVTNDAETELRSVAHHETGHAVVQFALGRRIERVSVVPDEERGSIGHMHSRLTQALRERDHRSIATLRERAQVQDWIVTPFAGVEAEARFRGLSVGEVVAEGGANYDQQVIAELGELMENSPEPRAARSATCARERLIWSLYTGT